MKYSKHWENYWEDYEIKRPRARENTKFQCALKLLPRNFESLLDIGGGNGFFIEMVKESGKGTDFTVIDGSSKAIDKCKEKDINAILTDFDGKSLPFEDDYFDVVTCLDVMEHIHHPWKLLGEMKRITKKYLIISTPNFAGITNRIAVLKGQPPPFMADKYGNQKHGGHIQFITFNTLKYQIEELGMKILDYSSQETLFGKRIPLIKFLRRLCPNIFSTNCLKAKKV